LFAQTAHQQSAAVGDDGEQGKHQDAGQNARRRQKPVRVDRGCLDASNLLGSLSSTQFGANACAHGPLTPGGGDGTMTWITV